MVRLDEIRPSVWDSTIEVMENMLKDLEFDGEDIIYSWRKDASMKRLERELSREVWLPQGHHFAPNFPVLETLAG